MDRLLCSSVVTWFCNTRYVTWGCKRPKLQLSAVCTPQSHTGSLKTAHNNLLRALKIQILNEQWFCSSRQEKEESQTHRWVCLPVHGMYSGSAAVLSDALYMEALVSLYWPAAWRLSCEHRQHRAGEMILLHWMTVSVGVVFPLSGLKWWTHLDDVVDGENHLGPLHRVDRVLLQTPLLLLQQTIKHGGDLRHLRARRTMFNPTSPAGGRSEREAVRHAPLWRRRQRRWGWAARRRCSSAARCWWPGWPARGVWCGGSSAPWPPEASRRVRTAGGVLPWETSAPSPGRADPADPPVKERTVITS